MSAGAHEAGADDHGTSRDDESDFTVASGIAGAIANHLRLAEQTVVAAILTWRDRLESIDPGGARWIVEARRPTGGPSGSGARLACGAGAVDVIVPTSRACRSLADFVRGCGLFLVDACAPPDASSPAVAPAAPVANGSVRLRLRTRSSLAPRPLVAVDVTIRSLLEHYRWTLLGGDDAVACEEAPHDDLHEVSTLLERMEIAGERLETSRVLRDCERRIEAAFTTGSRADGGRVPARSEAILGCLRDLLRSAISAEAAEATSALAELRLFLDSLPADREAERHALGSAIGRVELRRAEFD